MKIVVGLTLWMFCCLACEGPTSIQGRMQDGAIYAEDGPAYKITWWGPDNVKRYDYTDYVDVNDSCISYKPLTHEEVFLYQFLSERKKRRWMRRLHMPKDSMVDLTRRCGKNFILDRIDQSDPRIPRN